MVCLEGMSVLYEQCVSMPYDLKNQCNNEAQISCNCYTDRLCLLERQPCTIKFAGFR